MVDLDLNIIDWDAISAIATTLAFIIAYWSIYFSNRQEQKNRDFQLNLLKKEDEQKNLDEFVAKIIEIFTAISPIDILNYSSKFLENNFTEHDRYIIEQNAVNDKNNSIKLNALMIKMGNIKTAENLIKELGGIREIYGHWARNINLISMYLDKSDKPEFRQFITQTIIEMEEISIMYDKNSTTLMQNIHNTNFSLKEQCLEILECYESLTSIQLHELKKVFEKHLYEYIKAEQERINNLEI